MQLCQATLATKQLSSTLQCLTVVCAHQACLSVSQYVVACSRQHHSRQSHPQHHSGGWFVRPSQLSPDPLSLNACCNQRPCRSTHCTQSQLADAQDTARGRNTRQLCSCAYFDNDSYELHALRALASLEEHHRGYANCKTSTARGHCCGQDRQLPLETCHNSTVRHAAKAQGRAHTCEHVVETTAWARRSKSNGLSCWRCVRLLSVGPVACG